MKKVNGYSNYSVTKDGKVYSHVSNKWLKTNIDRRTGYPCISLPHPKYSDKSINRTIHSLILEAYVGPRPKGYHGCHLNGIPGDSRLDNLRYVTVKENMSHKKLHGTSQHGERHGMSLLTEDKVRAIRREYRFDGYKKSNMSEMMRKFRVSKATVQSIVSRRNWPHLPDADDEPKYSARRPYGGS